VHDLLGVEALQLAVDALRLEDVAALGVDEDVERLDAAHLCERVLHLVRGDAAVLGEAVEADGLVDVELARLPIDRLREDGRPLLGLVRDGQRVGAAGSAAEHGARVAKLARQGDRFEDRPIHTARVTRGVDRSPAVP
jgi:hypothetical protein